MYWILKRFYHVVLQFGLDPLRLGRAVTGLPLYLRNRFVFRRQMPRGAREFAWGRLHPCLADRFETSGQARGHYFHQDLWVAQRIFQNHPRRHVDIGSRLDGFVAHVAAYRPVEVFDIRPQTARVSRMTFRRVDIAASDFGLKNYCDSVSCLSVLEHLGLGRYGDPIDYYGHVKGWDNIHSLLRPGGTLYLSVPIGEPRIEFDAHRVFSLDQIHAWLKGKYLQRAFVYVNDVGDLVEPKRWNREQWAGNFGCHFGCGIFELQKLWPGA